jgi:hypothetical protein
MPPSEPYRDDGSLAISSTLARTNRVDTPGRRAHPSVAMLRCLCLFALFATVGCDRGPRSEAATPSSSSSSSPPSPSSSPAATPGKTFGAGITLADTTAIDKILAEPKAFDGKTVRVEGMIIDVCPKRGCWFEMAGEAPGHKLRFKVTDGEMVFPLDSKGMHAVAQGTVAVKELSLEDSQKYAEYQAKEYGKPYDPASITEPMQIVRIDGTGAEFRTKK